MTVAKTMESKLRAALTPERLVITDDSARHAGHAGARTGGESHFTVEIASIKFAGLSRVARQRRVYEILADELAGPIHALSIIATVPSELTTNKGEINSTP